ncbi:hypothetical protein [Pediococcus damnosus]|uniref:hypothetical protein n=1 Tax=Pediococcus damnosus TaxID=51663 RepID=UPI00078DEDE1|nr:hypothetical protein [Pediococcus damnosus]AMV61559.1 Hypothetical protein ADU69_1912 [Pediococcus damnosus]
MSQNNNNDSENKNRKNQETDADQFTTDKPSRSANRKSHRYTKLIITFVGIVIVLLFISPIVVYKHNQNNFNRPQTDAQIASSKKRQMLLAKRLLMHLPKKP